MIREEYYGESMPQLPASYFCEHADFASLKLSDAGSAFKSNKHLRSRSMKRTELSKDRTRGQEGGKVFLKAADMNQQSEGMQTRRLKSSDRLNKDFPNKLNRTNTQSHYYYYGNSPKNKSEHTGLYELPSEEKGPVQNMYQTLKQLLPKHQNNFLGTKAGPLALGCTSKKGNFSKRSLTDLSKKRSITAHANYTNALDNYGEKNQSKISDRICQLIGKLEVKAMESFNIYIKESQRQLINSATENLQLQQSEGDKECPKVGIKAKETLKPAVKPTLRPAAKLDVSNPMEAYYFQSANRDISSKKLPGQLSSKYTPQIESRNLSQSQSSDKYAISMESCNRSSSENKMGYQSPVLASGFLPRYAGKPKEQLSEDLEEESIRRQQIKEKPQQEDEGLMLNLDSQIKSNKKKEPSSLKPGDLVVKQTQDRETERRKEEQGDQNGKTKEISKIKVNYSYSNILEGSAVMPDVRKSNSHKEASSCAAPIVDCTLSPNDASEAANFQNYGNFAKQKGKVYLVDLGINDGDKAGKFYHQSSDYEDSEDKNSNVKSELKKDKAATCFFQSLKMPLRKISISRPVFEQRQTSHGHSNHSKSSRQVSKPSFDIFFQLRRYMQRETEEYHRPRQEKEEEDISDELYDVLTNIEQHLSAINCILEMVTLMEKIYYDIMYDREQQWILFEAFLNIKKYALERRRIVDALGGGPNCFCLSGRNVSDELLRKYKDNSEIRSIMINADECNAQFQQIIVKFYSTLRELDGKFRQETLVNLKPFQDSDWYSELLPTYNKELQMLLQQKEVHYNESTRELAKVDLENVAIINQRIFRLMEITFMINDLHGKRVKYFNDEDKCYLDEAHFRDYLNDWLPIFYRQFAARK